MKFQSTWGKNSFWLKENCFENFGINDKRLNGERLEVGDAYRKTGSIIENKNKSEKG